MKKFNDYLKDTEIDTKHEQAKEEFIKDIKDTYGDEKAESWLKQQKNEDLLK